MELHINNVPMSIAEKHEIENLINRYIKTNWQIFADSEIEILKQRRRQRRARAAAAAIVSCSPAR